LIYQKSFNAKAVNTLMRLGYKMLLPEITCWINLIEFKDRFSDTTCRNNYYKAVRNNFTFQILNNIEEKRKAYELILENRIQLGRNIYMNFDALLTINNLWPVDFFGVYNGDCNLVASAILYQFNGIIAYLVFWGDNLISRSLKPMDFLIFNLWSHYKSLNYRYIDTSTTTESGIPNETLLRFKEIHECNTSLRFRFSYEVV